MANQYYTINTGDRVRERYSQVTRFNGESQLPESWWSPMGPTPSLHRAGYGGMCRGIHGTDGQQFHPMVKHGEDMWLFTPDLCRSLLADVTHSQYDMQELPVKVFRGCECQWDHYQSL